MKPTTENTNIDCDDIELPPSPPEGLRTKKYDPTREAIPKRLAAIELIRVLKSANTLGVVGIVGIFTMAIVAPFSYMAGSIVAGVISLGLAWFLYRSIREKRDLEHRYHIDPKG